MHTVCQRQKQFYHINLFSLLWIFAIFPAANSEIICFHKCCFLVSVCNNKICPICWSIFKKKLPLVCWLFIIIVCHNNTDHFSPDAKKSEKINKGSSNILKERKTETVKSVPVHVTCSKMAVLLHITLQQWHLTRLISQPIFGCEVFITSCFPTRGKDKDILLLQ